VGDPTGLGLDPVRDALLAEARAAADRVLHEAAERASIQIAQAEQETEALVARARAEGEAAAELETISALAEARRRSTRTFAGRCGRRCRSCARRRSTTSCSIA